MRINGVKYSVIISELSKGVRIFRISNCVKKHEMYSIKKVSAKLLYNFVYKIFKIKVQAAGKLNTV